MSEELEYRLDEWLVDMEERAPLKLFMISGILVIIFLLLIGVVTSREFAYFTVDVMIQMGFLEDVVPLAIIDVVRHAIASAMILLVMFVYLMDLELTWLLLREAER